MKTGQLQKLPTGLMWKREHAAVFALRLIAE
jgi:hypothetical protein